MYQPLKSCVDNEGRLEAASWTKKLVSGGARGVSLKSKLPFMEAWAEILGFVREERSRLRARNAWGMRWSHYWDGNLGSQEASPAQR